MLAFLAPWLLGGLLLLAVPVLVHLSRRDRARPTAFPSLMFLEAAPHELERRRRLRDLPLFVLRCLAVALLVLAFARPFAPRAGAAVAPPGTGGREVVLLLDRSWSMGAGDRWPRALAAARRTVDGLGSGDRAAVVLFDAAPVLVQPATDDRALLRAALDSARPGSAATRYAPAIALAAQLLHDGTRAQREAVLVSDFQRAGWRGGADVRLPPGARLVSVDLGGVTAPDVAVTGVELRRDTAGGRERVAPVARVAGVGGEAARDVAVALEVNGRPAEARTVRLAPGGAVTVPFAPVPLPEGWSRATVRVRDGGVAANDALHVAASRAQVLRVLVVHGPSARPDPALPLRLALGLGERQPMRVEVRAAGTVRPADVEGRGVVVLHDAPPAPALAAALLAHVRRGGGLLVALGPGSGPTAWPAAAAPLLPATPGRVVDHPDGGARLAGLQRDHPVFDAFVAPRSGNLAAARVHRHRALDGVPDASVLARLDDGAPALVEHRVGAGRVLVWTSTLDGFWNDLPVQPVFVPLAQRLVAHVARQGEAPPWRTVGEVLDPARLTAADLVPAGPDARWTVTTPAGRVVRLGGEGRPASVALDAPGFWEVRRTGDAAARPTVVAVNVDPAEGDMARVAPQEIAAAVQHDRGAAPLAAAGTAGASAADREREQGLWWYLLAAVLALLGAETVLAARRPGAARAPAATAPLGAGAGRRGARA